MDGPDFRQYNTLCLKAPKGQEQYRRAQPYGNINGKISSERAAAYYRIIVTFVFFINLKIC